MSERDALNKAIADGVVSAEQAEQLKAYLPDQTGEGSAPPIQSGDPEDLRFLSSFNDIFLSVGLVILLLAVALFSGVAFMPGMALGWSAALTAATVAAAAWALAEYFGRRRRMLLPTMTLASVFALAAGLTVAAISAKLGYDGAKSDILNTPLNDRGLDSIFTGIEDRVTHTNLATAIGAGLSALVFHWRFRLSFALFITAVCGAWLFYSLLVSHLGLGALGGGALIVCGLSTLFAAIWFDMSDPERTTRKADNAFWLHLAAAPQLMIGLKLVILGPGVDFGAGASTLMLAALVAVAILSLAINRRAPIFSGLVTFIMVVVNLAEAGGVSGVYLAAVPLFVTGAAVVLLGAGWGAARAQILKLLPDGGFWDRLFPPETPIQRKIS